MSTICKLDRRVRLDRYLRKEAVRELARDVRDASLQTAKGQMLLATAPPNAPPEQIEGIKRQIENLFRFRIITELTLREVKRIVRDPRRSGATKEAILTKLGVYGS